MGVATIASGAQRHRTRAYFQLLLLLNSALMGCFLAQDLFLFYLCYEFMLLPLFFLIGIWGGDRSSYAALKFFLFTLFGSVFMLVVMVAAYFSAIDPVQTALNMGLAHTTAEALRASSEVQSLLASGELDLAQAVHSFSIPVLMDSNNLIPGSLLSQPSVRVWMFAGMFIAFAVKLPMVPIHTWLPDAHVEASTPISVILAGVLLKVGGYGLIRLCYGLFPEVAWQYGAVIGTLAVVSTLYPALVAIAQTDFKRMVAYSSISHMGLVLLGLASFQPEGVNGALFQLFNHGIISASLFLLVGALYDRTHDRSMLHYQGLWAKMPRYTVFVAIAFFAGLGLPGFSLFVSELLVFAGALSSSGEGGTLPLWCAVASVPVIVLGAGYFLRAFRRMFFGEFRTNGGSAWEATLTDLQPREWLPLGFLALLTILPGLMPHLFLKLTDGTVATWLQFIQRGLPTH
jgi:NADH-quinone oxidoreductase subunit M